MIPKSPWQPVFLKGHLVYLLNTVSGTTTQLLYWGVKATWKWLGTPEQRTSFMDSEMWISCNCHMSQICFLFFFSLTRKNILSKTTNQKGTNKANKAQQKQVAGQSWPMSQLMLWKPPWLPVVPEERATDTSSIWLGKCLFSIWLPLPSLAQCFFWMTTVPPCLLGHTPHRPAEATWAWK